MKKTNTKSKASPAPVKAVAKKAVKVAPKASVKTVAKVAVKKPAVKAKPQASKAAAKPAVKAKPQASKAAAKPVAKAPAKKPAKKPVKAPVKTSVKAPVKTLVKAPAKSAVKTTAKAPVKPASKPVAKPAPKAPPPPQVSKSSVKPAPKAPVASTAKTPTAHKPQVTVVPKPVVPKSHENHHPVVAGQSIAQPQSKKSSRGAKAASMVPPPPVAVVSSNAAKSSYGPSTTPSLPSVIPVTPKKDSKLANNWKNKPVGELSDAEILSMPDTEYMNDTQMAFFRLKLVGLKKDILANAGQTTENLREETVVVPDPADRATIEEEHALELRTRDRERKLLKKIEQSIQRIDAGDYGYCDETGEAIGVGRLLARPTATLSLEAQQRRELKQKMFGD